MLWRNSDLMLNTAWIRAINFGVARNSETTPNTRKVTPAQLVTWELGLACPSQRQQGKAADPKS